MRWNDGRWVCMYGGEWMMEGGVRRRGVDEWRMRDG